VRDDKVQIIADSIEDYALASTNQTNGPVKVRLLEVNLHCSGNHERDTHLLRQVYELLQQHPGSDRFCFNVISDQGRVQLEFPNVTTHLNPELETRLQATLGDQSLYTRWVEA
jgi:hypothetical protein